MSTSYFTGYREKRLTVYTFTVKPGIYKITLYSRESGGKRCPLIINGKKYKHVWKKFGKVHKPVYRIKFVNVPVTGNILNIQSDRLPYGSFYGLKIEGYGK